jgi:hypothetical protein
MIWRFVSKKELTMVAAIVLPQTLQGLRRLRRMLRSIFHHPGKRSSLDLVKIVPGGEKWTTGQKMPAGQKMTTPGQKFYPSLVKNFTHPWSKILPIPGQKFYPPLVKNFTHRWSKILPIAGQK